MGATSLRRCEDVSFDTRRTGQIETYWRRIQIISYVTNISHFICSKYQPLERLRWMPRKNTQRPIDVVKTSVWDFVGTTSLGRCEDVPFNTRRTDQFETYWRRPWDVVCLLGRKPLPRSQEQCFAPRNLYAAAQYGGDILPCLMGFSVAESRLNRSLVGVRDFSHVGYSGSTGSPLRPARTGRGVGRP